MPSIALLAVLLGVAFAGVAPAPAVAATSASASGCVGPAEVLSAPKRVTLLTGEGACAGSRAAAAAAAVGVDDCTVQRPFLRGDRPCGIIDLEDLAVEIYAGIHGYELDDPRLTEAGQHEIAGIFYGLIQQLSFNIAEGDTPETPGDREAYQWVQEIVRGYNRGAARFALEEYDEWKAAPCSYVPPQPDLFSFRGAADSACSPTFASLLRAPSPPTMDEFIQYGLYRQAQLARLDSSGGSLWTQSLQRDAIVRYSGAWAMLAGPGAGFVAGLVPNLNARLLKVVRPQYAATVRLRQRRANVHQNRVNQGVQRLVAKETGLVTDADMSPDFKGKQGLERLRNTGVNLADDAGKLAERGGLDAIKNAGQRAISRGATRAGMNVVRAVGTGLRTAVATTAGAGFFIAGVAVAVVTSELEEVIRAEQLRGKLQAYYDEQDALPVLADVFADQEGGASFVLQLLGNRFDPGFFDEGIGKVVTASPAGLADPPHRGDLIELSYTHPDGTAAYTERQKRVALRTWPIGVEMGNYGLPWVFVALDRGMLYRTPTPDERKAGATGWYPTGTLEYFDWNSRPRIAMVSGDRFVDLPGPGSGSMGGWDDEAICEAEPACRETSVLFALDAGGNRVRIALRPNTGTPAIINIDNLHGRTASTDLSGPHSGLVVGQTVKFVDEAVNPNGLDTTYTWEVETRCPHGETCESSDDPAFNGQPVETLTGQTARWTWPSAGTFHVRLTTEDEFGVERVAERDVTVVDVDPQLDLQADPPFTHPQVFGPITAGDTATLTGCILMPFADYTEPTVELDWGDGATASQTGEGASDGLSVTFGPPGGGCASHWRFTATHDYDVTTTRQRPVTLTVDDGRGGSRELHLGANLVHETEPAFTSGASPTFTAGSPASFTVRTTGAPTPAVTLASGTLPAGVIFQPRSDGTATISGSAHVDAGGVYPLTLNAASSAGDVDQLVELTVLSAPRITSSATATAAIGEPVSIPLTAAGYPAPTVAVEGELPDGLSLSGGSITGTPAPGTAGIHNVVVTATSSAGVASQALRLSIGNAPAITSPDTAPFVIGRPPSSFTITTTGFPAPELELTGTLPDGLQFHDNGDGTATIFGSAAEDATGATVRIDATNHAGTVHQDLTVNASPTGGPNVSIDTGAFDQPRFVVGSAGSFTMTSSDAGATLTAIGTLPDGITFVDHGDGTATLAGTPAAGTSGYHSLIVKAEPASGPDGYAFAQVQVFGAPAFTSEGTARFAVGTPGHFVVTTRGVPRASIAKAGDLPDGLTFTDNGDGTATIAGTPAAGTAGDHPITLSAENLMNVDDPVTAPLEVEVAEAPVITSAGEVHLATGVAGSFDVTASGHPAPALTLTGTLPLGVTFTDHGDGTATLEGTPTDLTTTSYPVVVQAASTAGTTSQAMTVTVAPRIAFTSPDAATFTRGDAGSFTIATTGSPAGTPATAIAADDPLPAGLDLVDHGDGTATLEGTPTGPADATVVTLAATNGFGTTEQALTVSVGAPPAFTGDDEAELTSGDRGSAGAWVLETTGFPRPALTLTGALPSGVAFRDHGDGTGTLEGQPAAGTVGSYPLVLHMDNEHGSTTQALTLHVTATATFTSPDEAAFVAGVPATFTLTTDGEPAATDITLFGAEPLPDWLELSQTPDQRATGEATLAGTAPVSAVGFERTVSLRAENGVPNGDVQHLRISVAPVGFEAVTPPPATLGTPYSHTFGAVVGGAGPVAFAVAGGHLPPGLTLSPDGTLSGRPQAVGVWTFELTGSTGGDSATTSVSLTVDPAPRVLQISEFRLFGRDGNSDWYARVTNATDRPVALDGWQLALPTRSEEPSATDLGDVDLAAGASVVVAGPSLSRAALGAPDAVGPPAAVFPGGLQLIAPDGSVVERVGEVGAPAGYFSGTPLPIEPLVAEQGAYVRRTQDGALVNTGDNASDFTWVSDAVSPSAPTVDDPRDPPAGGPSAPPPAPGQADRPGGGSAGAPPGTLPGRPSPTRAVRDVGPAAGRMVLARGGRRIAVAWRNGTFPRGTRLRAERVEVRGSRIAVRVSARRGDRRVRSFSPPLDVRLHTGERGGWPAFRARGRWMAIPRMAGRSLPAAWRLGWYRDRRDRIHVLTRRPATVGLVASRRGLAVPRWARGSA